ncbi:beta-glucosidase [Flagellimonas sp. 389]|uniref:glucoamylase family protein n=1 Tax=Flagellimonas sp. 389 TaxID=2835862 RepID=UPI001BD6CE84|nr:glucoamylase family protein [Flagellimonas sp. 389]MBS9461086.1 beta-glucosidase [Flagellimonas sp. 389]
MVKKLYILCALFILCGCSSNDETDEVSTIDHPTEPVDPVTEPEPEPIPDKELMDLVQELTFKYFWDFADADSGAARERYHPSEPGLGEGTVAIGGTGFGLMSILVGIERNLISREEGLQRLEQIVAFLETSDRFHGAWPHWLSGSTGKVIPFSPLDDGGDLVETAFLAQGFICIKEYFKNGNEEEVLLAQKADALWKGVEWNWYTQGQNTLYWHWSPQNEFAINLQLKGYNETLITYILAAASPDYSIAKEVYDNGWASNGGMVSSNVQYDIPILVNHPGSPQFGGPLFWAHYSYLGLNPNGLSDAYADYGAVNVNHSRINYQYCVENPLGYRDYGPDTWGLTASYTRNNDGSIGYTAHSPANDQGVISPTAAISSIPYTPEESLRAMQTFYRLKDMLLGPAGFYDAYSPQHNYWVAEAYLAIDQGPQIIMIENYRTGLLWNLFMQNEDVQKGLDKLGFTY